MGIPLPALQVQSNQTSPLDTFAKVQGIQDLQQRTQAQQLENQKSQIALQDQQASTKAMNEWDGKDLNELPPLILKHGGSANAVFGAKQQITKLTQDAANADEAKLKNQQTVNDLVAGHLEAVKTAPDKQAAFDSALTDLESKGLLKPGQIPHQYPGDDQLSIMEKQFMGQKAIVDQTIKDRETAAKEQEATARADTAKTGAERLAAELPGGALEAPDKAEMRDYLAKNPNKGPADYAKWKASLSPTATFNLQNAGATGTPGKPSAIAQGIADGSMKWNDVVSARTPMAVKQAILSEVKSIKPDFNSGDFALEQGVKKEFTSGDAAKNLTAFNTAIEHANQLQTAANALNNGDLPTLNKIGNALGYQFGSDKTTNFNVIKNALTGEISKVFKGGGATDAEIEAVQGPFSQANSPAQLRGAIANAVSLMNSKRDALKQQYDQGVQGKPNFGAGGSQGGGQSSNAAPPANDPFAQFGGKLHQ